ncbi:MarR family winged helix-turn-helix transcriptional regulator [Demequina iriomotensis]|uniref:MarR family winged helix-turn-helix transcriptional regulator n=1 Tax=Demequina iriomotensis TaxID=1536641 RepID=UPI000782EE5D|nr:MarR family transcriptional regulator [Demequina iriomotensis]
MTYEAELAAFAAAAHDDLGRLLVEAARAVTDDALARIDPDGASGVRAAHVPVIAALDAGGSRVADLAPRIGHTRQAVAALVRDLEAAGIVAVRPDPADRRASLVALTEAGAAFCARATEVMRGRELEWREAWGDQPVDALRAGLARLAGTPRP